MKRLSGTDAVLLSMEAPSWHQHVGGLLILDPEGREITFEKLLATVDERIPLAPKFTWKLKQAPLNLDRPAWVDDADFDVRNHVHRAAVPTPGGMKEAAEVAGRILGTQLDRRRPLWELWFLEGLAHGRVGMVMKYHHCLLDGMSGAALAAVLMDLEPEATGPMAEPPTPEEASAGPEPTELEQLANLVGAAVRQPVSVARFALGGAGKVLAMARATVTDPENRAILRAPKTPWNEPIGPRRSVSFSSVPIEAMKAVKDAQGVKLNDVVLSVAASALRNYLLDLDVLPPEPLVTAVPVSLRQDGDTAMDNQVAMMFVSLATDIDDPVERLQAIYRSSQSAKEMRKAVDANKAPSVGEVAAPLVLSSAVRTMAATQLFPRMPFRVNTIISNVPGPPIPIYSCGGRVTGIYSTSVIVDGVGLNCTVFSFLDRIDFGFHVDPELVPDPWAIANRIPAALDELLAASGLPPAEPVEDPFGETSPHLRQIPGADRPEGDERATTSPKRTRQRRAPRNQAVVAETSGDDGDADEQRTSAAS
jgi:diacylglycerol O-acyltransferase / wax synthase